MSKSILSSAVLKLAVTSVLCFAGAGAGVYVGFAMHNESSAERHLSLETPKSGPYVNFNAGDLFPLEDITDASGQVRNFEQLLSEKPSIVFFVHFGCESCFDLLKFWQAAASSRLRPNVQCIVAIEQGEDAIPPEYAGLVSGMQVVYIDGGRWRSEYHMQFWPTIVAVDDDGLVIHIQFGFENSVDYQIAKRFLEA